jgi:hypothetical protein
MARKALNIALATIFAASPAPVAAQWANPPLQISPEAASDGRVYCMHMEALTGNIAERVQCWTRAEWADQGVDVDKEYPKNGVRTEG